MSLNWPGSPPPLVDSYPDEGRGGSFIPPPAGSTFGGQGIHDAFPGAAQHGGNFGAWANEGGGGGGGGGGGWGGSRSAHNTPWVTAGNLPPQEWAPNVPPQGWAPPRSAPANTGWTYGQYQPSPPYYPTTPGWANTPANWGAGSATPGTPGFSSTAWRPPPASPHWGQSNEQPLAGDGWFGKRPKKTSGGFAGGLGYFGEEGEIVSSPNRGWFGAGAGGLEASTSMPGLRRSHSQGRAGASPRRKRSNSMGGGGRLDGWGEQVLGERNLARRPRDWRADYSARGGIMSSLTYSRNRSDIQEISDPVKRMAHALLAYTISPPVELDLRHDPLLPKVLYFTHLNRPHNQIDFDQMACQPPVDSMRLYHPRLPWYIDIHRRHPNGITVGDVFEQMHVALLQPITGRHFWNEDLRDTDRAAINAAFRDRVDGDEAYMQKGVMKVDFLGMTRDLIFQGLMKGKNGMWEIRTKRIEG